MNPEFLYIDPESIAMITLETNEDGHRWYRIVLKSNTLHINVDGTDENKVFIDGLLKRLPAQNGEEARKRIMSQLGRGETHPYFTDDVGSGDPP